MEYRFGNCRVSVLTERLLRLEYDESRVFEDRPSQFALDRHFPEPCCSAKLRGGSLELRSDGCHVIIGGGLELEALTDGLSWRSGQKLNHLGGTARTLDNADGAIELEPGLFSREGVGLLSDDGLLFGADGELQPRRPGTRDIYLFLYGRQFERGLRDFYRLSGRPPLLPRFALGNWWSRFWPYTAEEYLALMERFDAEGTPFSVAVLDMDWHLTRVPEGYSGWTGYTWDRELIPEPDKLLARLHGLGLHVSLNLHPAEGVQPFEERYGEVAEFMGVTGGGTIPFDLNDRRFRRAYFELLLHPLEDMGVDFWWIDWQQGTRSTVEGLDPLWLLNHWHFLDAARRGRRPLILSRYAGPGSHRYPVGFSGDTIASWASLDFQPRFTAAAADISSTERRT